MSEWWKSERSRPTGPGSRGGTYHLPGNAAKYAKAWRAAHPEYRDREKLRRRRDRAAARGEDPEMIVTLSSVKELKPVVLCSCSCPCDAQIVTICRLCSEGDHQIDEASSHPGP